MEFTNEKRRRLLTQVAGALGFIGVALTAVPFVRSMRPSARALAAGGPIQVDVTSLGEGRQQSVEWRGKPVWILHRTPAMINGLKESELRSRLRDPDSGEPGQQPAYAANPLRSIDPQYFVAIGLCTHLGCVPLFRPDVASVEGDWPGGYFCPCHGSKFDLAGRVYKAVPAPTNLVIPPHRHLREGVIEIGVDPDSGAV